MAIKRARYRSFADNVLQSPSNVTAIDSVGKDAFSNPAARMGWGTPSVAEDVEYTLVRWTMNYWLMITLFRNHWLARKIVEIPASDMCKAWPRIISELTPEEIKKVDKTISATLTRQKIKKAITWANLFGGAGALMVVKGHENILDEPLNLDDVTPGSYRGLIVFDRWSGITPTNEICTDVERPDMFGLPEFYNVHAPNTTDVLFKVHASRIIQFNGPDVPSPEFEATQYWGISKLELAFEELRKRDNASWSILQLMFRAQIMTQVNPELAGMISGIGASQQALVRYQQVMQAQNELLSNNSMMILPKDGKLETHQYSFSGISDVLDRFEVSVSGAAGIPYSKLFGRNVSALGQTNEADERNYEETIQQEQHDKMKPQLEHKLYPLLCVSEFGEAPEQFDLKFPSIRVLSEKEKAELATSSGEVILKSFSSGVTTQKTTLQELSALGDKTEIFTNITPEIIDNASDTIGIPLEIESMAARSGKVLGPDGNWLDLEEESDGKKADSEGVKTRERGNG